MNYDDMAEAVNDAKKTIGLGDIEVVNVDTV